MVFFAILFRSPNPKLFKLFTYFLTFLSGSPPLSRKNDPSSSSPPLNDPDNWENELLADLNDYELVNGASSNNHASSDQKDADWDKEISELLKHDVAADK